MKTSFETQRLFFREILPSDDYELFELDSDPEVHLYLGNKPVKNIQETRKIIANIRQQYLENGIGRWAAILKETGEFIGWAGLKVEKNVNGHYRFYDLGYRLKPQFWNRGFATESAKAFIDFGFSEMKLEKICAYTSALNAASAAVLRKCGMQHINTFVYDGADELWFEIRNPSIKLQNSDASHFAL
ncbi:MAG: GNAT family N-acetyltransferase [Flavobacterium sp.]|nr:GNAT family N-acetyltransferase [Flavobacterium sp.]